MMTLDILKRIWLFSNIMGYLPAELFNHYVKKFDNLIGCISCNNRKSLNIIFLQAKERGAFNIQSNGADYNLCNETLVLIPDDIQNIPHAEENESEEETRPKLGYQLLNEPISYRTPKTYRCTICQYSTSRWIRHSIWLDCCIGEHNRHLFLLGCSLGIFALFFGSNLSLTSICHPYFVFKLFTINVLMPDDCSDVFDQFE